MVWKGLFGLRSFRSLYRSLLLSVAETHILPTYLQWPFNLIRMPDLAFKGNRGLAVSGAARVFLEAGRT